MGTLRKWSRKLGLSPPKLPQDPYQSPDPYGEGVQWDESGMPVGRMPRGEHTLDYQYEANRRAEQRRNALWGDAQNAVGQGVNLLSSYRPGGSAALASGMYGQKASLYGTQAQTIEAPDLLIGQREHERQMAERDRKRANRLSRTMGFIKMGAALGGAEATGGASLALMPDGMDQIPQPGAGEPGGPMGPPASAQNAPMQPLGLMGPPASAQQPIANQGYGAPIGPTPGGQPLSAQMQPGQQGPPAPFGGAPGTPGGQLRRGSGAGAPAGGGQDSPAGGAPGGGQAAPGGMGPMAPPMAMFTPTEAAANAMSGAPVSSSVTYADWADDPVRQKSVFIQMASARARLLAAMA